MTLYTLIITIIVLLYLSLYSLYSMIYCTKCGKIMQPPCKHDLKITKVLEYNIGADYLITCNKCGMITIKCFNELY